MVTLQGEKKRWNGIKPWCLTNLVSSFNPYAPCSRFSLCFPLFSLFLKWHQISLYDLFERPFIPFFLTQLASRVGVLAMASWAFFPSGFLPRQLWGVRPPLLASQIASLAMASKPVLLPIYATRHGELEVSNFNFLPQLAFELAVASCSLHFFMFSCF